MLLFVPKNRGKNLPLKIGRTLIWKDVPILLLDIRVLNL